jgi:adenine-specific DNA-methyltransferase
VPAPTQLTLGFARRARTIRLALVREAVDWAGGLPEEGLSAAERQVLIQAAESGSLASTVGLIEHGACEDPFAAALVRSRSLAERRLLGQFLTPSGIVDVMVDWVRRKSPGQVIDAGCGTGRFAIAAARAMPKVHVVAVDSDPFVTLLCRAYAHRYRLDNIEVHCADFLTAEIPLDGTRAAFIGNPPYVRHHRLSATVKAWGARASARLGVRFSKLAGLHAYFFLATALRARPGDVGCYITSSEWLDVGYGQTVREMLLTRLGVRSVSVLAESSEAFDGVMTTAAITCFEVGRSAGPVQFSSVPEFRRAEGPADARHVDVADLDGRWGAFVRPADDRPIPRGGIPLRRLVSVHRGIATGANDFFVMDQEEARRLGLASLARPIVTSAKEILNAGGEVRSSGLKVLIHLPRAIDPLSEPTRGAVRRYLARGKAAGIPERYLCRQRRPWWWLGESRPAPIVASYMARRAPAFALNPEGALILNIAHGLFPRERMSPAALSALVKTLNRAAPTFVGNGRRYQGGLEKFEPREMEHLLVLSHGDPP